MKKRENRLVLSRETLRRLQDEELTEAQGGMGKPTHDCTSVRTLCPSCLCPI